jgi:Tfp pilus assembly protein PilF
MKQIKLTPKENNLLNAFNWLSQRNYYSARESLLAVIEESKEDEFALTSLAQVFIKEQNFFEAATIYEDLNKTKRKKYLPELCEALVLNSHNAEGEQACMLAAKKFPKNPYPLIFAGITHRERESNKRAASLFRRSLNIRQTEMANVCLAELSLIENKPDEAANYFKLSLEQSPYSPRAMLGLAWSLIRARDFEGALEAFRSACKVNKKYEVEVRKAYKKLTEDKILIANRFMKLAQNCQ